MKPMGENVLTDAVSALLCFPVDANKDKRVQGTGTALVSTSAWSDVNDNRLRLDRRSVE